MYYPLPTTKLLIEEDRSHEVDHRKLLWGKSKSCDHICENVQISSRTEKLTSRLKPVEQPLQAQTFLSPLETAPVPAQHSNTNGQ